MELSSLILLLGGLALFLHGMQLMSGGLEAIAGNRIKTILEKLTSNRVLGVLAGAGITAVIQSSSATTVMVVGFVDSGMMTLKQAMWIIMGANIGTTITAQLVSLDIGEAAPLIAFFGAVLMIFGKKPQKQHMGSILMGFGILFLGMGMMSGAVEPLRDSPAFVSLLSSFSNPLIGIAAGAVFTAIMQSSSATISVLQALALSGVIGLPTAVYVIFGQNIGTCITALLASVGAGRNAKRTTIIHLMFNLMGTAVFTLLCMETPLTSIIEGLNPLDPVVQIANMHTLFNVVTTLLLMPMGGLLVRLAMWLLPDREGDGDGVLYLAYLEPCGVTGEDRAISIGSSAIYITKIQQELDRMMTMAKSNVFRGFDAVAEGRGADMEKVHETEKYVDFLNQEISKYISHMMGREKNRQATDIIGGCFKIAGNIERIAGHAMNVCDYTVVMEKNDMDMSLSSKKAVMELRRMTQDMMTLITQPWNRPLAYLTEARIQERSIDDKTNQFRTELIENMKTGSCSEEVCMLFSEMLIDFERIGDHALKIAEERALMPV